MGAHWLRTAPRRSKVPMSGALGSPPAEAMPNEMDKGTLTSEIHGILMGYWWDIDGIQSWNIWNLEKWMNWMVMNLGFQVFVSTCSNTLTNKNGNVGTQDSRGKCHGNLPKSMIYLFNIFQHWHFPRQTVRLSTAKRIQNMGALIQPHNRQNLFVFLSSISHISPSHFFGAPSCG